MKKRILKITGMGTAAFGFLMAPAYSLFDFVIVKRNKSNKIKNKTAGNRNKFQLSQIKMNHPRNGYEDLYEAGREWCMEQDMRDCYIWSRDGLMLHALYLPADDPKRSVLLSHGYRGSSFGDFANIARFLHDNGCNLLFIDQRCCGKSEGKYITFGAMEQYDILKWSYYLAGLNEGKLPVYLYGESLGAAAVLMSSAHNLPAQVRGLIADSAFSSMRLQMKSMALNWFNINRISIILMNLDFICRSRAGFKMADADTSLSLEKNRKPVLFFHGLKDTFVDPKNTLHHYSECRAPKEIVLIPGARHLCSAYADSRLYRTKLMEFFKKYD